MLVISGLTSGNLLHQYLQEVPRYMTAMDRSFFQAISCFVMVFVLRYSSPKD